MSKKDGEKTGTWITKENMEKKKIRERAKKREFQGDEYGEEVDAGR